MLVNKHNRDILPLLRERIEHALDRRRLGFLVDDEEVLLGVGGIGDVLPDMSVVRLRFRSSRGRVVHVRLRLRGGCRSRSPVMEPVSRKGGIRDDGGWTDFIADYGNELAVLVGGLR